MFPSYVFVGLLVALVFVAWTLTLLLRKYALKTRFLDVPNHRSSHKIPTPSGGGVGFILLLLAVAATLCIFVPGERSLGLALLGGGAVTGFVGWLDDRRGLSARLRFVAHLCASCWAVGWLGGITQFTLGETVVSLGMIGFGLTVFGFVWSINLFNFMDGIDGLAGAQAVIVGSAGGLLFLLAGDPTMALVSFSLAASVAGFLIWNWQPAKIFMGDCGSGFLGFMLAVMALAGAHRGSTPLSIWLILMGVFLVDATATLLRRMINGEKWYEAHKTHAFQHAVGFGWSHRRVTIGFFLINLALVIASVWAWAAPSFAMAILILSTGMLLAAWGTISYIGLHRVSMPQGLTEPPETIELPQPGDDVPSRRAA